MDVQRLVLLVCVATVAAALPDPAYYAKLLAKTPYADRDIWRRLIPLLERACESVSDEDAEEAETYAAKAATCQCRAHVDLLSGEAFDARLWIKAADLYAAAHAQDSERGKYLERAARVYEEFKKLDPEAKFVIASLREIR